MLKIRKIPVRIFRCYNYDFFAKINDIYIINILAIPRKILNDVPFIVPEKNKMQYLDYAGESLKFTYCKINKQNVIEDQRMTMIHSGEFGKGLYLPITNPNLETVYNINKIL